MSIRELMEMHDTMKLWAKYPRAWVLQANPVWGRCEQCVQIALFDTEGQANEYIELSRLPETLVTDDGITRSFRTDSLLYNYNPHEFDFDMVVGAVPWKAYGDLPQNPSIHSRTGVVEKEGG